MIIAPIPIEIDAIHVYVSVYYDETRRNVAITIAKSVHTTIEKAYRAKAWAIPSNTVISGLHSQWETLREENNKRKVKCNKSEMAGNGLIFVFFSISIAFTIQCIVPR